ncbi:hypothetical protein [Methylobacterium oxalidis]|uniref:hypothetical protein n=1 Tax=Methylobacterium oxalidis TaxID=944322 RepID=UPI003315AC81
MLLKAVMRITKAGTLAMLAMTLLPDASLACRSGNSPKAVLLEDVPPEAAEAPVIARVVVTDVYETTGNPVGWQYNARVRVIEAIKGVEMGQIFTVRASPLVCSTTLGPRDIGKDGFVAGEFRGDQILFGFWDLRHSRKKGQP